MYWQLWLPIAVLFIGWHFQEWLDAYHILSIPYMIIASWSFVEFFTYLAERA